MTELELYTLLTSIQGFSNKVAYDHFLEKNEPPFILYRNTDSDSCFAEDKTFIRENRYIVDFVSVTKDTTTEALIETAFDSNNVAYEKQEDFIQDERIYQIRYFI